MKAPQQYKGFTLNRVRGVWRAEAYANEQLSHTNLKELKKQINQYLRK